MRTLVLSRLSPSRLAGPQLSRLAERAQAAVRTLLVGGDKEAFSLLIDLLTATSCDIWSVRGFCTIFISSTVCFLVSLSAPLEGMISVFLPNYVIYFIDLALVLLARAINKDMIRHHSYVPKIAGYLLFFLIFVLPSAMLFMIVMLIRLYRAYAKEAVDAMLDMFPTMASIYILILSEATPIIGIPLLISTLMLFLATLRAITRNGRRVKRFLSNNEPRDRARKRLVLGGLAIAAVAGVGMFLVWPVAPAGRPGPAPELGMPAEPAVNVADGRVGGPAGESP